MAHASGVASNGTILSDLMSTVPSIMGIGTRFPLYRASTPLSNVDPEYATHVSLLTSFGSFFSSFNSFVI